MQKFSFNVCFRVTLFLVICINTKIYAQWDLTANFGTEQFYISDLDFPSENIGFISGQKYSCVGWRSCWMIKKTNDGGSTWITQNLPVDSSSGSLTSVSFINNDTGAAVGYYNNNVCIVKTADGGTNWNVIQTGIQVSVSSIQLLDANYGYIAGDNGMVLKTTDGGNSWNLKPTGIINYLKCVYFLNPDTGFVGGDGIILKTTDGGATWSYNALVGNYTRINMIQFLSNSIGYAVGNWGYLFKTIDGGLNWNVVTTNFKISLNGIFMFNENEGFVVGNNGLTMKTNNGFNTWNFGAIHTDASFQHIQFVNQNKGYLIANMPWFFRTTTGGSIGPLSTDAPALVSNSCFEGNGYPAASFSNIGIFGGSGPYTYQWNPSTPLDNPSNLNPSVTGIVDSVPYILTVHDGVGTTKTDTVMVSVQPFQPQFIVSNASCDTCTDGSALAFVFGPSYETYSYEWYDTSNAQLSSDSMILNVAPGEYFCNIESSGFCWDTKSVKVGPFKTLHGHIYQSNNSPLKNSRVYLIEFNAADSSLTELENTNTDSSGYFAFNTFASVVYVKAVPGIDDYPHEMPTYFDSSLVFQNSSPIYLTGDTTEINFNTIYGNDFGGRGFIGGLISEGAGKMSGMGVAVSDMNLILVDQNGFPTATTSTNTDGVFGITNLNYGQYSVWADKPFINNTLAPVLETNSSQSALVDLRFKLLSDRLVLDESTSVPHPITSNTVVHVYPNPTSNIVNITLQLIKPASVKIELVPVVGNPVTIAESALSTGRHVIQYDLKDFKQGIYFLSVKTHSERFVTKMIKMD